MFGLFIFPSFFLETKTKIQMHFISGSSERRSEIEIFEMAEWLVGKSLWERRLFTSQTFGWKEFTCLDLVSVDLLVTIVVVGMINVLIIFDDGNILNVLMHSWLFIFKSRYGFFVKCNRGLQHMKHILLLLYVTLVSLILQSQCTILSGNFEIF